MSYGRHLVDAYSELKQHAIVRLVNKIRRSGSCPRGGMVDTRDLKSLGLIGRAGSSPAVGTRFRLVFPL